MRFSSKGSRCHTRLAGTTINWLAQRSTVGAGVGSRDDGGWIPYFCTDSNATVRDVFEAAADRWAIEEHFNDVNEVWTQANHKSATSGRTSAAGI